MTENGYEYIDLGLPSGTMWATCNVGADKPEDSGLLFQWGRTDGYMYGDKNNQFKTHSQNKQDTENEFIPKTTSGKVYKSGDILELEDDAAHTHMGSTWRIPTKEQLEELYNNTTHKVETINGVQCMVFTSKINNKQLFVQFAGCWYNGSFGAAWSRAYIWSSQVHPSSTVYAYRIYCSSGNAVYIKNFYYRSAAFSVRGVFKSNDTSNEHKNNINMLI